MTPDEFDLVPLRSGGLGIRSRRYDEICHPGVGPRAEAEALYVRGLNLAARRTTTPGPFVVWDVGLGGAANACAVVEAAGQVAGDLTLISFDRQLDQLVFAVRHATDLGYFGSLAPQAARLIEEPTVTFQHGAAAISWMRVIGDFPSLLAQTPAGSWPAPHAILFDPHSPAANPEMWTLNLFRALHARLDPNRPCALATYSRSTAIRTALLLAGFWVGVGESTPTKEDTTVAANQRALLSALLGARWLARAQRSRAAEPWTTPPFGGRPLSEPSWEALRRHPQFDGLEIPPPLPAPR